MNRALFLDRDGVVNEDYGYVHKVNDFHLRDGIIDICLAAQRKAFKIIVVTNQAGIGRGYYTHAEFYHLSLYMTEEMLRRGVRVDDIFYCPFHECYGVGQYKRYSIDRKPNAGMIIKACNKHCINPFMSIMIGDKGSDQLAAHSVGIRMYVDATKANWVATSLQSIKSS